MTTYWHN